MGDLSVYLLRLDSGKVVRVTQPNIFRHAEDAITDERCLPELACLEPGRGDQVSEAGPVVLMGNARPPAQPRSDVARWLQRMIPKGKSLVTSVPYLWLLFFFLIPFVIVLKISFSDTRRSPCLRTSRSSAGRPTRCCRSSFTCRTSRLVQDDLYWMSYLIRSRWRRSPRCSAC